MIMLVTSRSSFFASLSVSDGDDTLQEMCDAAVSAERPDETCAEETVVSVMGDAIGVGEDTLAFSAGYAVVEGDSFYATIDLLAVAASESDLAYTSTGALLTYSGSADAVFSIQTSRTHTVSDASYSLSASTTSGSVTGISWGGDVIPPLEEVEAPDLDVILSSGDGCGSSIEGNVAFAMGDAAAFGDGTFTDLSLSVFTLDDTMSSASIEIYIVV